MNILKKAISELRFRIPIEVLDVAFSEKNDWRNQNVNLDEKIMNKVIRPRFLVDCNIHGGQSVVISLDGINPIYQDSQTLVFEIPPERLSNRTILSVLSVTYLPFSSAMHMVGNGIANYSINNSNEVSNIGQRIGDAMSSIPPISTGNVELSGHNTVTIRNPNRVTGVYQLRCYLANEENLNNINIRSANVFAKAVEFVVKSYIYNTLLIKMGQSYLLNGQELGEFKNYVESLSDAEENYQTYLKEVLQVVSFMNDTYNYDRFIKMQISPGI